MKAKDVQEGIVNNLFPFLKENEFRKRKNGFTKQEGDFYSIILYSWVVGDSEYPTSFSFWVCSHIVHKIQALAFGRDIRKDGSMTLVAYTQSMVFNMKPKEFHINTNEDIIEMCNLVKQYLETKGFQFFKDYQDYNKILNEMKSIPPGLYYSLGFSQWALNALTMSKMLDDPEYSKLASEYINYSETNLAGTDFLLRLKELDNFLKTKSSEVLLNY